LAKALKGQLAKAKARVRSALWENQKSVKNQQKLTPRHAFQPDEMRPVNWFSGWITQFIVAPQAMCPEKIHHRVGFLVDFLAGFLTLEVGTGVIGRTADRSGLDKFEANSMTG
jgi:hypothetical protein